MTFANRQVEIKNTASGMQGTIQNTPDLIEMAVAGSVNFEIIRIAREVLFANEVDTRDPIEIANVLFHFVKNNIRYVRDPSTSEMFQGAHVTLQERAGDCDCMVILLAALNMAVGNIVRIAIYSIIDPEYFDHVMIEVLDRKTDQWISYDAAYPGSFPGWSPPKLYHKIVVYPDGQFEYLAGFFSKIKKKLKKFWNKVKEIAKKVEREIRRFRKRVEAEVKRFADDVKDELRRFERSARKNLKRVEREIRRVKKRLQKNLARELQNLNAIPGVGILIRVWDFTGVRMLFLDLFINDFRFQKHHLIALGGVAASIGSLTLSIAAFGAGLLSSSIFSLTHASTDALKGIVERKEMIEELKKAQKKAAFEEQASFESIKKLEHDIEILEQINEIQREYQERFDEEKARSDALIAEEEEALKIEFNRQVEEYSKKAEEDLILVVKAKEKEVEPLGEMLKIKFDELRMAVEEIDRPGDLFTIARGFSLDTFSSDSSYSPKSNDSGGILSSFQEEVDFLQRYMK